MEARKRWFLKTEQINRKGGIKKISGKNLFFLQPISRLMNKGDRRGPLSNPSNNNIEGG
jgi:hypothetical protein